MPPSGITQNRRTIVEFDCDCEGIKEPRFLFEVEMEKISRRSNMPNVLFRNLVGWQLKTHWDTVSTVHEKGTADASVQTVQSGRGVVDTPGASAKGVIEEDVQQESGAGSFALLGIPAYSGGRGAQKGDRFAKIVFGSDGDTRNSSTGAMQASQSSHAALASSNTAGTITPPVPMDRVYITAGQHLPTQGIRVRFDVPGVPIGNLDDVMTIWFTGVPSSGLNDAAGTEVQGTGVYAIHLKGGGVAFLYEQKADNLNQYELRSFLRWSDPNFVSGSTFTCYISTDAREIGGKYYGSKIIIEFSTVSVLTERVFASLGNSADVRKQAFQFNAVLSATSYQRLTPAMVDVRRDVRARFQVSYAQYYDNGRLTTNVVAFPRPTPSSKDLTFYFYGVIPSGTSMAATLYNAETNVALTTTASGDIRPGFSGFTTATCPAGVRAVYAVVTLTTDSTKQLTPTLIKTAWLREGATGEFGGDAVEPTYIEGVSISGQAADPSLATARITCTDLSGELDLLRLRAGMPVRIKTRYDPADPTKYSVLFQGFAMRAPKKIRGPKHPSRGFMGLYSGNPGKAYWGTYRIDCNGEWQRLSEQLAPVSIDMNVDRTAGTGENGEQLPWKATDAIRQLLLCAGFPPEMMDIPDLPDRLFSVAKDKSLLIEQFTPVMPIILRFARDILGMYLVFDYNASNGGGAADFRGCWRLKHPPRAPYNTLCEFVFAPNVSGQVRSVNLDAYASGTNDAGNVLKRAPVIKGTYYDWVQPPEGNLLLVTGVGAPPKGTMMAAGNEDLQIRAGLQNFVSVDFGQDTNVYPAADPDHPDYLGRVIPIYYCDPGLGTQRAVEFVCRRIYDMACHAVFWCTFESPLVLVTDEDDSLQLRPRPLQFGDVVIVNGKTMIVNAVHIDYQGGRYGDRYQACVYECFAPPHLQNYTEYSGPTKDAIAPGFLHTGIYK